MSHEPTRNEKRDKRVGVSRLLLQHYRRPETWLAQTTNPTTQKTDNPNMHGLAGSIRNADDNETFDLAGKSASTIEAAVSEAFATPFPGGSIRITFVTGAGKLARQKYDEDAAKAVTSVLRNLGYREDQSGGDGTFKLQHDTGKNLKTVVVHPLTETVTVGMENLKLDQKHSLLEETSHEYKLVNTSTNTFARLIEGQCVSWSQKRNCVSALENIKHMLEELDKKLLAGSPLDDAEQDFYDSVSVQDLQEKETLVREQMHKLVEDGQITAFDKGFLLSQVNSRLETIQSEIESCTVEKKRTKLEDVKAKAIQRKDKLSSIQPIDPHKLKHHVEIAKLQKELTPLLELENQTKGRLLSVKESQSIARKDEILAEIEELERKSRGWFESDEEFEIRLKAARKTSSKKSTTKPKAPSSTSNFSLPKPNASAPTKWITPSSSNNRRPTGGKLATASQNGKPRGGGVFAAMMMDSDSD